MHLHKEFDYKVACHQHKMEEIKKARDLLVEDEGDNEQDQDRDNYDDNDEDTCYEYDNDNNYMVNIKQLPSHDDYNSEEEFDELEEKDCFVDLALLSHIAMRLRDKVPRGIHVRGGIPYPRVFTGKDIVVNIFFFYTIRLF